MKEKLCSSNDNLANIEEIESKLKKIQIWSEINDEKLEKLKSFQE
jgi:hypothetical protein